MNSLNSNTVYILPMALSDKPEAFLHLPVNLSDYITLIDHYFVENIRTARRYIKKINPLKNIDHITFHLIDKHLDHQDFKPLLKAQYPMGILSESGNACIADPGYKVVFQAQQLEKNIYPISGPSSLLMALSASGLNGQKFSFEGYFAIDQQERLKTLKNIERNKANNSFIFIETPYRNTKLFDFLIENCKTQTTLSLSCNLTEIGAFTSTKSIKEWKHQTKKTKEIIHKNPCVFILSA